MTDDLSTRLLEAISATEQAAQGCRDEVGDERVGDMYSDCSGTADRDAFPSYPWGSMDRELAYMAGPGHPDSVLRLCQAHREIVDLYRYAFNQVGFHENFGEPAGVQAWKERELGLRKCLEALAHGYGLEVNPVTDLKLRGPILWRY